MRWIAFFPITPGTSALFPNMVTRWPTRTWGSQPPISATYKYPSSSTWVIWSPISSMCPASITCGLPDSFSTAKEFPVASTSTCPANVDASVRHTRPARNSNPDGPAASRSCFRNEISWLMVTQVGTWGSESKAIRGSPRWPRPGTSQLWLARIPNGTSASQ